MVSNIFLSLDFSLDAFLRDSAITAYDQIKGLALDRLKEALGLPTFLNDPPCSLTDPSGDITNKGLLN
jgi:hypothetical protein